MNPITNAVSTLMGTLVGRASATDDAPSSAGSNANGTSRPLAGASDMKPTRGEPPPLSVDALQSALDGAEEALRDAALSLDFRVDEATERMIITVRDSNTDEIIRQIPPEERLNLAEALEAIARGETDVLASGALVSRQA
jgi:flagellar protein FlaG